MNKAQQILQETKKVISGKDDVLVWVLTTLLAKGNVLLEDIPGVGKTTMVLAFAKAMGLSYGRVQFNPDVLPSDIIGFSMLNKQNGEFQYQAGAIMCNLFLADELNRATSRTQSALLEAMEERQVTVDGNTYALPEPFFVIATQNPVGAAGTQLLPDSQIDRFMTQLSIGYPSVKAEVEMVKNRLHTNPLEQIQQVVSKEEFISMQEEVERIHIHDDLIQYMVDLCQETRLISSLVHGVSPRATLALASISKAIAYLNHRDYVLVEDIQLGFLTIMPHRLLAKSARNEEEKIQLLKNIISRIKAPKV